MHRVHFRNAPINLTCFHSGSSVFLCGSAGQESDCNAGELGSIPGLGRSHGEGKGYLLQCSGLENSMDCTVHGVGHDLALPFLRRGKETGDPLVGGAARTHTFVKFAILSKRSLWSPNNYNSNI